jgi:hypothetical protein
MDLQVVEWGMLWIDVAQNGIKWRAHVNAVISLGFHTVQGITGLALDLLAPQERLCSM